MPELYVSIDEGRELLNKTLKSFTVVLILWRLNEVSLHASLQKKRVRLIYLFHVLHALHVLFELVIELLC